MTLESWTNRAHLRVSAKARAPNESIAWGAKTRPTELRIDAVWLHTAPQPDSRPMIAAFWHATGVQLPTPQRPLPPTSGARVPLRLGVTGDDVVAVAPARQWRYEPWDPHSISPAPGLACRVVAAASRPRTGVERGHDPGSSVASPVRQVARGSDSDLARYRRPRDRLAGRLLTGRCDGDWAWAETARSLARDRRVRTPARSAGNR